MDIQKWMADLIDKCKKAYDDRLLFVGLQGSYRRGEATATSDIDAVVLVDKLSTADLNAYRALVKEMPHSDKACGFISGPQELWHWPRHELFFFVRDTVPCYGSLEEWLPSLGREDAVAAVRIGASGLYHSAVHTMVHGPAGQHTDALRELHKAACFVVLGVHFLRSGQYAATRRELLEQVDGAEQHIVSTAIHWDRSRKAVAADPDSYFDALIRWSGQILCDPF